jgi:trans-aconitate 2-methyltransferase
VVSTEARHRHGAAKPPDWDAATYDRLADPQQQWAEALLARLPLRGDECVLDAGCGSGRVTRLLLDRLPHGRVYAVDRSPAMLAVARTQLAAYGERVTLIEADLRTLRLPELVEVVFSNATLHWISNHARAFGTLASVLRPRGLLAAQCGGRGNITRIQAVADQVATQPPFRQFRQGIELPWRFAGPEETQMLLEHAGFVVRAVWLAAAPAQFANRERFAAFLRSVVLGPYLAALPEELHEAFVQAVVAADERAGAPYIVDYVRLNIDAVRAG